MTNIKVVNGTLSSLNPFEGEYYLSDASVLDPLHLSVTDIALYLTVAAILLSLLLYFCGFYLLSKYNRNIINYLYSI